MTATASASSSHRFALAWYGLAFALLGTCIGLMAGMSQSPVIGVLLPLLFSLIGGAGGLHLAGVDFDDSSARRKLRALGIVLSVFTGCVIVASLYGALLRTGARPSSLLPGARANGERAAPPGRKQEAISASGRLELLVLRKKLEALGANPAEQEAILATASSALATPYGGARVQQLFLRLQALARQARETLSSEPAQPANGSSERAEAQVTDLLARMEHSYGAVADRAKSVTAPSMAELRNFLSADEQALSNLLHEDTGTTWANQHPRSREAVWKLELSLLEERAHVDDGAWMSGGRVAKEANELLATLRSPASEKPSGGDSIQPAFAP